MQSFSMKKGPPYFVGGKGNTMFYQDHSKLFYGGRGEERGGRVE